METQSKIHKMGTDAMHQMALWEENYQVLQKIFDPRDPRHEKIASLAMTAKTIQQYLQSFTETAAEILPAE